MTVRVHLTDHAAERIAQRLGAGRDAQRIVVDVVRLHAERGSLKCRMPAWANTRGRVRYADRAIRYVVAQLATGDDVCIPVAKRSAGEFVVCTVIVRYPHRKR